MYSLSHYRSGQLKCSASHLYAKAVVLQESVLQSLASVLLYQPSSSSLLADFIPKGSQAKYPCMFGLWREQMSCQNTLNNIQPTFANSSEQIASASSAEVSVTEFWDL